MILKNKFRFIKDHIVLIFLIYLWVKESFVREWAL